MTRLVDALKEVGQTFELFKRGEIGPCESTPSPGLIPNLVPSSYCRVPVVVPGMEGDGPGSGVGGKTAEPVVINPTDPELQIAPTDEKVDVRAKFALKRMLNNPAMATDAARLILGLKGKKVDRTPGKPLAGIFGDDLGKAVEVARDHGTERWLIVPKGEDAALVLVNKGDPLNDPPTVIFRGDTPDISKEPGRLDKALQEASQTFELFQQGKLGLCTGSPSAKPVANLVPSTFCQVPAQVFTLRIRLLDSEKKAIKHAPYRLKIGDVEVRRGNVDEMGILEEVDLVVPNQYTIQWGSKEQMDEIRDKFPYQSTLFLDFDEGDEEQQARRRLHNLGYSPGESLESSIFAFQRDYKFPPEKWTGTLDEETKAKLAYVHDEMIASDEV